MKRLAFALIIVSIFVGCTSEAPQAPPKPKPPELLTGRSAFQQLYIAARGWAGDARPYQLQSTAVDDANGRDGQSAIWRAAFASASLRKSKPYSWVGVDSDDSRGVSPGQEDNYIPGNDFDVQFLKVDSDQAFKEAQKHGGDKILQSDPKLPVTYLLEWNRSGGNLVWHVIYGNTRNEAKQVIDVDATTGAFIRKEIASL